MIRLHRLQANGFKQLRDVDLTFPERCIVLIEGENEAGKSSLLEAVYFALYGASITSTNRENLISNRLDEALIQLAFSVGGVRMNVMRLLRRRAPRARLQVIQADGSTEEIQGIERVNDEIISYLHGLDKEALRNSCLVEQKGLGRLEELTPAKRQDILLKLLDQDRLLKVRKHFEREKPDERLIQRIANTVRLAQVWRELRRAKDHREKVERQLLLIDLKDTVDALQGHLHDEQRLAAEAQAHADAADQITQKIATVEHWNVAIGLMRELRTARRNLANFIQRQEECQRTLDELHVLEQERLPILRNQQKILEQASLAAVQHTSLNNKIVEATDRIKRLEEILELESRIMPMRAAVDGFTTQLATLQKDAGDWADRLIQAKELTALLAKSEALRAWAAAHRRTTDERQTLQASIENLGEEIGHVQSQKQKISAMIQTSMARRRWAYLSLIASGLVILISIVLSLGGLAGDSDPRASPLALAVALLAIGIGLAVPGAVFLVRINRHIKSSHSAMSRHEQDILGLATELAKCEGRSDAFEKPAEGLLATPRERLGNLGLVEPESAELADQLAAEYETQVGDVPDLEMIERKTQDAEAAARRFEIAHAPESGELRALEADLQKRLQKEGLEDVSFVSEFAARTREELGRLTQDSEDAWATTMRLAGEWLGDASPAEAVSRLNKEKGQLEAEIGALGDQVSKRPALEEKLRSLEGSVAQERASVLSLEAKFNTRAIPDSSIYLPAEGEEEQAEEQLASRVARANLPALKTEEKKQRDHASRAHEAASRSHQDGETSRAKAGELLARLGIDGLPVAEPERILSTVPELTEVEIDARDRLVSKRDDLVGDEAKYKGECENLSTELGVSPDSIDELAEVSRLAEIKKRQRICHLAETVIGRARTNLLNRLLPDTLDHARLFLPLLTDNRYFDADLDETSFRLKVWDAQFGQMMERELFSGGAQDQFALALRLGFAIATLPQELGAAPAFIFLDEPVASFDRVRREAFVKLVLEGEIGQRFSQIFIAEPEGIFPENPFPHYIRMKTGRIDALILD